MKRVESLQKRKKEKKKANLYFHISGEIFTKHVDVFA